MRKMMTKPGVLITTLALLLAMYSPFLLAQTNSMQHSAMSWPMQQGEKIRDVARLFYPKNPDMQRHFVAATLKLNQGVQADTVFTQGDSIMVPDIKWLSRLGKGRHSQASVTKDNPNISANVADANIPDSALLHKQLDDLIQKNTFLKQQLEALTTRLARLEEVFAKLKSDWTDFINKSEAAKLPVADTAPPKPLAETKAPAPAREVTSQQPQESDAAITPTPATTTPEKSVQAPPGEQISPLQQSARVKLDAQTKPAEQVKPAAAVKNEEAGAPDAQRFSAWYWIMPLLIAALIIGFFVGLDLYNKKYGNKKDAIKTDTDEDAAIEEESFNITYQSDSLAEFTASLPHTKFSDSILLLIPEVEEVHDEKEEAELMLNQARIYDRLKRYDNAIRLLNAYIKAVPKSALPHRFLLLDIYHKTDQKDAFLEVARQLHQAFNVELLQWNEDKGGDESPSQSIEDYDHIIKKITKLWMDCDKEAGNLVQIKSYIDKLLTENRGGQRTGFSADVFEDLMLLRDTLIARERLAKEVA